MRDWQEMARLTILENTANNPRLNIVTSKETTVTSRYGYDNEHMENLLPPSLRPCCMLKRRIRGLSFPTPF